MKQKSIKISCTDLDLILLRKIFEYIYIILYILYESYTYEYYIRVYAYDIRVRIIYIIYYIILIYE